MGTIAVVLALPAIAMSRPARGGALGTAALVRAHMAADIVSGAGRPRPDAVAFPAPSARRLEAAQEPDGRWPDIHYDNRDRSLWPPIVHLERVLALAREAATHPGDSAAPAAAIRGLEYWLRRDPTSANWWWNTIGMQQQLAPILILLRDRLPAADLAAGCRMLARSHVDGMTGTNLVWEAANLFALGAITDDVGRMRAMLALITGDIAITTREGLQPDLSFQQHGPQLNAGNYGLGFLETCGRYAGYVRGTPLQLAPSKIALLARFAVGFQDWVVWGRFMDLSSCGRQLDLPDAQTRKALALADDCRRLIALGAPDAPALAALVKRATGLLPPNAEAPTGDRYYWRSDFLVHRPGDWYASVKMYSDRVLRTETAVNDENYKGYHLCDGTTFILVRGDEYKNIQPVWDWRRLPGVTFRDTPKPLPYGRNAPARFNPESFVGGVSDGTNAVAAMDFHKEDVRAHKAWFCFPGGIVCLGCGLASDGASQLTTSINQCRLRGAIGLFDGRKWTLVNSTRPVALPSNDRAVLHAGIGYVFLEPERIRLSAGPQTGSWAELRKEGASSAPVSEAVFGLWISHGRHPTAGTYAYAELPRTDAAQVEGFVRSPAYQVLSNTPALQAVLSVADGVAGAVFHAPGRLQIPGGPDVAAEDPCLVLIAFGGGQPHLSVSDPTQRLSRIRLAINGARGTVNLAQGGWAGASISFPMPTRPPAAVNSMNRPPP